MRRGFILLVIIAIAVIVTIVGIPLYTTLSCNFHGFNTCDTVPQSQLINMQTYGLYLTTSNSTTFSGGITSDFTCANGQMDVPCSTATQTGFVYSYHSATDNTQIMPSGSYLLGGLNQAVALIITSASNLTLKGSITSAAPVGIVLIQFPTNMVLNQSVVDLNFTSVTSYSFQSPINTGHSYLVIIAPTSTLRGQTAVSLESRYLLAK